MEGKFAHILGMLGLKSNTDAVTEAHLQAADDKIAQLELEKSAADTKATQAEAARVAAQTALDAKAGELTKVEATLADTSTKLATLEDWKKKQAAADGRTEDDSNSLDKEDEGPKASWEVAAAGAISGVKKRLGEK